METPSNIGEVYGVMKAYSSRVGEGPYVTELKNKIGDTIRELGHEYGATTKRPRRCGYLDLVALIFGTQSILARIVYGLVAICGIINIGILMSHLEFQKDF